MRAKRRISGGEGGYVLLGIVLLIVIMGIFMGAAVPIWQHLMRREKEDELIWRGNQYIRAIELYQRKHPGAYPAKFEDLVEQKFLRKLYKDPMSEDGEWKVLRQLSPEVRSLMGTAGAPPGAGRRGRRGRTERRTGRASETRPSSTRFGGAEGQGLGGIVGVASKNEEESIRVLDGKEHYNEWLFVYAARAQAGRPPRTRPPGAPGPPGAQRPSRTRRPGTQQPRSPGQRPIQQQP